MRQQALSLRPRRRVLESGLPDQQGEDASCICGSGDMDGMLDCDDCHKWYGCVLIITLHHGQRSCDCDIQHVCTLVLKSQVSLFVRWPG